MPAYSYVVVSLTGARHASRGNPTQDRFKCMVINGMFIGTIADGAGSCDHAGRGAELAVSSMTQETGIWATTMPASFADSAATATTQAAVYEVFRKGTDDIDVQLSQRAAAMKVDPTDMSTTVFTVVRAKHWAAAVGYGDTTAFHGKGSIWDILHVPYKRWPRNETSGRNATKLFPREVPPESVEMTFDDAPTGKLTIICCDGALDAFARDTTPLAQVGTYKQDAAMLHWFASELGPLLTTPGLQGPGSPAEIWLLKFVQDKLVLAGERDDITIVVVKEIP